MVTENEAFTKENIRIYAIGGKGLELLKHKGYDIVADYSEMIEEPSYDDAKSITKRLLTDFENGEIGEIYLIYTFFKNYGKSHSDDDQSPSGRGAGRSGRRGCKGAAYTDEL